MKPSVIPAILSAIFLIQSLPATAQEKLSLVFPADHFVEQTKTVKTLAGDRTVTIRSYLHIPYVSAPKNIDYQSLNVFVPVRADGKKVDATHAPILFDIGVGGYMSVNNAESRGLSHRADLALASGYVVVSPGCRGRDNRSADGRYFGKAPAAIVDLKAAVRYIRHNRGLIPGNTDCIVSVGCSAGGALSALLGTSGNNPLFDSYLKETGAADEKDDIFAAACYSPITDLDHADMAYEWMFGTLPARSGPVNQVLSEQLKNAYSRYQLSLGLQGKENFGILTAQNYRDYLLNYYLSPSLSRYLEKLSSDERNRYLENNPWINRKKDLVEFTFDAYLTHVGRMKGLPAFDDFECRQPEPGLFGNETLNARHFTEFSLRHSTGDPAARPDAGLVTVTGMMNALNFIGRDVTDCAAHWWLRNGTGDNHTSQTVMINLATKLENAGKNVNTLLFWDGGHCADDDPEGFIEWMGKLSAKKPGFREWAPTPPMGWNSWDCYGPTVEEHEVKANADYLARYLKPFGWEYVVVDIRWFVENDKAGGYNETDPRYVIDEYGRYQPAVNRFPSAANGRGFIELARYIHDKGLKFGIHIMRGIPKLAVERKLPVEGAGGITADQISSTENLCKWLGDNYTIAAGRPGSQEYYNSIFRLYAGWGVDFVKIDDLSAPVYHQDEIEMIRRAIDACGRPIVLSTSPGATPVKDAAHISEHANMWRMVNDVWDSWWHISNLFEVCRQWYPWIRPGTWPDCDMIPLGRLSIRGEVGPNRMTRLTREEQYTLMTLFTIFRSPLFFGGDLPSNDEFTLSLLTNTDVLRMHRESSGVRLLFQQDGKAAITSKNEKTGETYLALFNISETSPLEIAVGLEELGLQGTVKAKDMWSGENAGEHAGSIMQSVDKHACKLFCLTKR